MNFNARDGGDCKLGGPEHSCPAQVILTNPGRDKEFFKVKYYRISWHALSQKILKTGS